MNLFRLGEEAEEMDPHCERNWRRYFADCHDGVDSP